MYNIYSLPLKPECYKHVLLKRGTVNFEDRGEAVEHVERMSNSLSRTKRLFHDYAFCNSFDLFVTFTFDRKKIDRYDLDSIKKKLGKFFNNYQNRVDSSLRYMIVPEQHKDGAYHFHGLMSKVSGMEVKKKIPKKIGDVVEFVDNTKGYISWEAYSSRFGFFSAAFIHDYSKCVSYCYSYITKSFGASSFKGVRLLMKSQGLCWV